MRHGSSKMVCATTVDMPALDPCVVDDEEALAALLGTWAASDPVRAGGEVDCFEAALRSCLDASRWRLAARLLGLVRAADDDRLARLVGHALAEGRRFPLPPEEDGAS
jgi:hypothetical protein